MDGGGSLRYFALVSLLAHGLLLVLSAEKIRPFLSVDRNRPPLLVELKQGLTPIERAPASAPGRTEAQPPAKVSRLSAAPITLPVPTGGSEGPDPPPARGVSNLGQIDGGELLAISKAEIASASRRHMLDPMFAQAAQQRSRPSPLERATEKSGEMIERLGDDLLRITTNSGQRYCLQRLPEFATRDSPLPVMAVPMHCP